MSTFLVSDSIQFGDGLRLTLPEAERVLESDFRFPFGDAVGFGIGYVELVSDTLALSDAVQVFFSKLYLSTDSLQLLDNVGLTVNPGIRLSFGDSLNFNDLLSTSNTNNKLVADAIALSDVVADSRTYNFLPDAIALSDAVTTSVGSIYLNVTESLSDSLSLSDSIAYSRGLGGSSVSDTFNFGDAAFILLNSTRIAYLRRYLNDIQ